MLELQIEDKDHAEIWSENLLKSVIYKTETNMGDPRYGILWEMDGTDLGLCTIAFVPAVMNFRVLIPETLSSYRS